jgi:hypothetical protein
MAYPGNCPQRTKAFFANVFDNISTYFSQPISTAVRTAAATYTQPRRFDLDRRRCDAAGREGRVLDEGVCSNLINALTTADDGHHLYAIAKMKEDNCLMPLAEQLGRHVPLPDDTASIQFKMLTLFRKFSELSDHSEVVEKKLQDQVAASQRTTLQRGVMIALEILFLICSILASGSGMLGGIKVAQSAGFESEALEYVLGFICTFAFVYLFWAYRYSVKDLNLRSCGGFLKFLFAGITSSPSALFAYTNTRKLLEYLVPGSSDQLWNIVLSNTGRIASLAANTILSLGIADMLVKLPANFKKFYAGLSPTAKVIAGVNTTFAAMLAICTTMMYLQKEPIFPLPGADNVPGFANSMISGGLYSPEAALATLGLIESGMAPWAVLSSPQYSFPGRMMRIVIGVIMGALAYTYMVGLFDEDGSFGSVDSPGFMRLITVFCCISKFMTYAGLPFGLNTQPQQLFPSQPLAIEGALEARVPVNGNGQHSSRPASPVYGSPGGNSEKARLLNLDGTANEDDSMA